MVTNKQQVKHRDYPQKFSALADMNNHYYHNLEETREDSDLSFTHNSSSLHQHPQNDPLPFGWEEEAAAPGSSPSPVQLQSQHFQSSSSSLKFPISARDSSNRWEDPYHYQHQSQEADTTRMNQSIWSTTSGGNNDDSNDRNLQKIQSHPPPAVSATLDGVDPFYSVSTNQTSLTGVGGVPQYHHQPQHRLSPEARSWYGSASGVGSNASAFQTGYKDTPLPSQERDTSNTAGKKEHRNDGIHELTSTMSRLATFGTSSHLYGEPLDYTSSMNASVASINTGNSSSIPGVLRVSSGSTGGRASLGGRYQQQDPPLHEQHLLNTDLSSGSDPNFMSQQQSYPSQYPVHQYQQQGGYRPVGGVPPGFGPHQQGPETTGLGGSSYTSSLLRQDGGGDSFASYDSYSADISSYRSVSGGSVVNYVHQQQQQLLDGDVGAKKHGGKRVAGDTGGRNNPNRQQQRPPNAPGRGTHSPHHPQQARKGRPKQTSGRGGGSTSSLQAALQREDQGGITFNYAEGTEENLDDESMTHVSSKASSEAIRMLMNPRGGGDGGSLSSSTGSALVGSRLPLDRLSDTNSDAGRMGSYSTCDTTATRSTLSNADRPILPVMDEVAAVLPNIGDFDNDETDRIEDEDPDEDESDIWGNDASSVDDAPSSPNSKKRDWLLRMNRRLTEIPVGELDPSVTPISAIMNAWAKTKSAHGASMVETWLNRAQEEFDAGNKRVVPTNKMYTMAVDAWAKSGEGVSAAQRAEAILQHMHHQYQVTGLENLRPTTGIFNAVINSWARSKEKIAPNRAEQILKWMDNLNRTNPSIRPDKYTFNTVIHAYAKSGGPAAAKKAQQLLSSMHRMYQQGNQLAKPDTITYNVVINSLAKSGGKEAAVEAEKLLATMHKLYEDGDPDVKPNVVTYGAVIDAYAKSGEKGAAARADALLAKMIHLHQIDPVTNGDLQPNTYVFNTVINAHAKSKEHDAASKAEEMLLAMNRLHSSGMPNLKPDAFTYTAVIDAWAKSGYRGAAARADQLLDKMEAKYLAGDMDLKPNTFTYNAVINALAKSGEPGAAARAERVLHNMVNRHRHGASEDVKPTTINFNSVLDAWAKSGGGRKSAERAEEILEWMDRLYRSGNQDVRPDTITFNAVLDAWARSGDRMATHRAEQILDHMDELYRAGNHGVKPDTYTYNTLINAHAKSAEKGSAARAEHVLQVMKQRYLDGDNDFKPNTRTHTSVIDAWAKSGEKGAAKRAEQILNNMISNFEEGGDVDIKPNVHTANAVCNACAFTKMDEDRPEALQIAFRVFDWLASQPDMEPDAYTYTILLSVCSNLLPREDRASRFSHAKAFFEKCCEGGHVNDYVLRKLRQTVSEQEYLALVEYRGTSASASNLPPSWTRKVGNKNRRVASSGGTAGSAGGRSKGGGAGWSLHSRRPGGSKF